MNVGAGRLRAYSCDATDVLNGGLEQDQVESRVLHRVVLLDDLIDAPLQQVEVVNLCVGTLLPLHARLEEVHGQ